MSDYETEEQQIEAIKDWWKENGKSVLLGAALGIGGILSWRGFVSYEQNQAVVASDLYAEVSDAAIAGDTETVTEISSQLRDDFKSSSFAAMASLMEARVNVQNGDLESAKDQLQWVVDHVELEEMQIVAKVRQARVLLAQGKHSEALSALPTETLPVFNAQIAEIRGDILLASGDVSGARNAYSQAQASARGGSNRLLGMKLDDLAIETPALEGEDG